MSELLTDSSVLTLLGEASAELGVPAPFWFVTFFKIVGFVLHMLMMNLWFAGLPLAVMMYSTSTGTGRRWSNRFFQQLPIFVALGINFGIVPLLFLQTTYYESFYTSTILMAWPWLAVLAWVMTAYYCVYIIAFASKKPSLFMKRIVFCGLLASVMFLLAGITMSTGMTLMSSPDQWESIWQQTLVGGAVTGTAFPVHNFAVLTRFLTMFGIAMVTTAAWCVFDAFWLTNVSSDRKTPQQIDETLLLRKWSLKFAGYVGLIGAAIMVVAFNYYLNNCVSADVYQALRTPPFGTMTMLSCGVFLIPVILISLTKMLPCKTFMALVVLLAQVGALAVYAVVRQWIQYLQTVPVSDVAKLPDATQWQPLIAFLIIFVFGLSLCGWIIAQAVKASNNSISHKS